MAHHNSSITEQAASALAKHGKIAKGSFDEWKEALSPFDKDDQQLIVNALESETKSNRPVSDRIRAFLINLFFELRGR